VKSRRQNSGAPARNPKIGLPRALSKIGYCSRTKALTLIRDGKVRVNGTVIRDSEARVDLNLDRLEIAGRPISAAGKIYIIINKPRGLVVTSSDEKGRETVYDCLTGENFPWLAPVGRLDKASEGLLLFTNDSRWAAAILDPQAHIEKTYHVQIDRIADGNLIRRIKTGTTAADGEFLFAKRVTILRRGTRNCWLVIVLDEGKNRQIRRLLAAFGIKVLRLVRVAIGPLLLGGLAKRAYRHLSLEEVRTLAVSPRSDEIA
jgi:23S rRNA pseudouridine2605 synthase